MDIINEVTNDITVPPSIVFIGEKRSYFKPCTQLHRAIEIEVQSKDGSTIDTKKIFQVLSRYLQQTSVIEDIREFNGNRFMFFLEGHTDSARAYRTILSSDHINLCGTNISFSYLTNLYQFRKSFITQRVSLYITELPYHLWSKHIVEQILSGFCVVDYISTDSCFRTDLSSYHCIAWTRTKIWIPDTLEIKVVGPIEHSALRRCYTYTIGIQKSAYSLRDPWTTDWPDYMALPYRTVETYTTYIDASSIDQTLIDLYSESIIIEATDATTSFSYTDIFNAGADFTHVRKINTSSYIILPPKVARPENSPTDIIQCLKQSFSDDFLSTRRWSRYTGAKFCIIRKTVTIDIDRVPCFMRTEKIVEQLFNTYGLAQLLRGENRDDDDKYFQHCRCRLWFSDSLMIPVDINVNILPDIICTTQQITSYDTSWIYFTDIRLHVRSNNEM